jgi:DNA-binding NtrC family response regulator
VKPTAAPRGGSESVLLVEDEKPVRQLIQRLLESGGYRVQAASTGAEALELWQRDREAFDVVITDIVMPGGLSGTELAEKLTEARPATKVIFISGYTGELSSSGKALHEGVNFLQKPFSAERLLRCVRACLDESSGRG